MSRQQDEFDSLENWDEERARTEKKEEQPK